MSNTAYKLPEEDKPEITPDIPGIKLLEGGGEASAPKNGHLSDASKGSSSAVGSIKSGLSLAEAGVGLATGAGEAKLATRAIAALSNNKKKTALGGGILGSFIILFVVIFFAAGPLQLIHLAETLKKSNYGLEQTTKIRTGKLFRYAKRGTVGHTRLSYMNSRTFNKTIVELEKNGITFKENRVSRLRGVSIDTDKLSKNFPELRSMSGDQRQAFLSERFGVPLESFESCEGSCGSKFTIRTEGFDIKTTRGLLKNSLFSLSDGKKITGMRFRVLAKYFNSPSIFHPMKKAGAKAEEKLNSRAERRSAAKEAAKDLTEAAEEGGRDEAQHLATKKGFASKIIGVFILTQVVCEIRDVADSIVKLNRALVVLPSAAASTKAIAVGSQVQAGEDVSMAEVSKATESLVDDDGKSVWDAQALQALEGKEPTGKDMPFSYAQPFAGHSTAKTIEGFFGGGVVGAAACSTPGKIVQGVGALLFLASGILDAGASDAGYFATKEAIKSGVGFGAKEVSKGAAMAGATKLTEMLVINWAKNGSIMPKTYGGPLGGNLMALGSRESANMSFRSSGGVELSDSQAAAIIQQERLASALEFNNKSLFEQIFDTHDSRSISSRYIDKVNPSSATQNLASFATFFTKMGSILPSLVDPLSSKVFAASGYEYNFPAYGIPDEVLNDPNVQNPYENGDAIAELLKDSGKQESMIKKVKSCFGSDLIEGSEGWDIDQGDASPETDVNPNSEDYDGAGCNDLSDPDWRRMIMFVFDTQTMKGAACYQGDDAACTDLGMVEDSSSGDSPGSTAGSTIDMNNLYKDSSSIACAPGTEDTGVQDGYTEERKVLIRTCSVPNMPGATVNSRVSGAVYAMAAAAKKDGISLSAGSSFRTMAEQQVLWDRYGHDTNRVAKPGRSNHQMGLAIDFGGNGYFEWLSSHASEYGYKNYPAEAWHWSPTGN